MRFGGTNPRPASHSCLNNRNHCPSQLSVAQYSPLPLPGPAGHQTWRLWSWGTQTFCPMPCQCPFGSGCPWTHQLRRVVSWITNEPSIGRFRAHVLSSISNQVPRDPTFSQPCSFRPNKGMLQLNGQGGKIFEIAIILSAKTHSLHCHCAATHQPRTKRTDPLIHDRCASIGSTDQKKNSTSLSLSLSLDRAFIRTPSAHPLSFSNVAHAQKNTACLSGSGGCSLVFFCVVCVRLPHPHISCT
jgi:hypothetical protein